VSDLTLTDQEKGGVLVALGEDGSTEIAAVGGKGASLGRLVKAGFPVPSGFVVTTDAYASFIRGNDLAAQIEGILADIDYGIPDKVEEETAKIREAIIACELPEDLAGTIVGAYQKLADEPYVAVRSSGTAEDLEGASFAGQYDTYLDVRGGDALLDAVRRCWASMWTARVTAYRQDKGFDHGDVGIAVVVQTMIEPDVAGVMFIGNPMNARADEIVINASWGLGEALVSGRITPDEYIVGRDSLQVKSSTLGSKELQVVRNPESGSGTIEEPVPIERQSEHTLSDEQAGVLAELGRRVTTYYDGLPQDTEWAMADGTFYLLQSRPVTGVEFTWEEDLDLWPSIPEEEDAIWTRAAADEWWTGAITPLFWSIRGYWVHAGAASNYRPFGIGDLAEMRWMKYRHGTMYYNTRVDELMAVYTLPPSLRAPMLQRLHPTQRDKAMNAPFDLWRCLKFFANIEISMPEMSGVTSIDGKIKMERIMRKGGDGYEQRRKMVKAMLPSEEELQALGDDELKQRIDALFPGVTLREAERIALREEAERAAPRDEESSRPPRRGGGWGAFFFYGTIIEALLESVMQYWYDGDNANAFTEVISGLSERTQQFHDDYDFWKLADTIRQSEKLLSLIEAFEGAAFFEELANHEEGRAFLSQYEEFMEMNFYRGHADRDIYYDRRIEDPMLDYKALHLMTTADDIESPEEREEKLVQRREAATAEVIENLEQQPMGDLKVEVFKFLQGYCLKIFMSRDDGRSMGDAMTYRKKLLLGELGARTVSRGLLEGERDFYFLSIHELCELLDGKEPLPLARAKIAARRKGFENFLSHEEDPPIFLKGDQPFDLEQAADGDGVLRGVGTSPGAVTARARIVPTQKDISRLEKGDVLICHGTDPGWTSAFSVVSGVIAQTGGMLGHFSCLSREYGIPAISLPNAMKLIEDGSVISMNGGTGEVRTAVAEAAVDTAAVDTAADA
jgi:pyruvate,water dikinase|tara:strand:+ start:3609 stop:6497 length:2889 start_codon:yes stop_codon:yes gene_type:complete